MFSNLGPLFKATFRQAEQADTRMAIRKDDPRDQGKRRESAKEEPDDNSLWEDSMAVSIDALRGFLVNFVQGKTHAGTEAGSGADAAAPDAPEQAQAEIRPPRDTQTARAMQAYQSMAEHGTGHHLPPRLPSAPVSDVDLIEAGDVRVIHRLIEALDSLAAAGHESLVLEKADSFLHSIEQAVSRLQSKI